MNAKENYKQVEQEAKAALIKLFLTPKNQDGELPWLDDALYVIKEALKDLFTDHKESDYEDYTYEGRFVEAYNLYMKHGSD